jgi:hypothetical protein
MSLRTPQNDPSVDLWTRYAGGNISKSIRQDSAKAGFAHLLPSSPQTPSTIDSRGKSIRRVVSCGTEWPTTEIKKRKTPPKSHARVKDIFAASKKRMFSPELPRSGRVGLLLEKIQESLSTKPVEEIDDASEGPSSSSPIPDGHANEDILPNAPKLELSLVPPAVKVQGPTFINDTAAKRYERPEILVVQNDSSSDYGGDEIDYELFEQVEFAATQAMAGAVKTEKTPSKPERKPPRQETMPPKPPWNAPSIQPNQCLASLRMAAAGGPTPAKKAEEVYGKAVAKEPEDLSDDEFGLDDPDFAEQLGDLVAQFESQEQQDTTVQQPLCIFKQATTVNEQASITQLDDIDEFGEFDDPYDDDVWTDIANGSINQQITDGIGSRSQVCGNR